MIRKKAAPRYLGVRLLVAQLINQTGTGVSSIALPLLIYGSTHDIVDTSLVYVINTVPTIVFGLIGGAHADRANRRKLIVMCGLGAGVSFLLIPGAYDLAGLVPLVILGFVGRTFSAFSTPALRAALPGLFGDSFQEFIGRRAGVSFIAQALGPAIGGALVGLIGAPNTILVDGASWIVYAGIVATISGFDPDWRSRAAKSRAASTLRGIRDGLAYLRHNAGASSLLVYWFFSVAAVPISLLAAIPYVRTDLGQSAFAYGVVSALYAIGSLISSWVSGKLKFPGGARRWLIISGLGYGLVNVVMIFHPGYIAFCVLWFIWGLAYGPEEVVGQVAFARVVPPDYLGRMYSVMNIVMSLATLAGAAAGGALTDGIGPLPTMLVAGLLFIAATLGSFAIGPGGRILARVHTDSDEVID